MQGPQENQLSIFNSIIEGMAGELRHKARVPTWCKRCGRKHKGICDLTRVERRAKGSGRYVTRYMHSSLVGNDGKPLEGI